MNIFDNIDKTMSNLWDKTTIKDVYRQYHGLLHNGTCYINEQYFYFNSYNDDKSSESL